ncbi:MAG: hypothetical protein IBX72_06890 [Nitrospirae bacterium]|nr:hypothetical protein [Nitrospirota bacterium]
MAKTFIKSFSDANHALLQIKDLASIGAHVAGENDKNTWGLFSVIEESAESVVDFFNNFEDELEKLEAGSE